MMVKGPAFQKAVKYVIFACICVAVIIPSIVVGFFQAQRSTSEATERFQQHIVTVVRELEKTSISPDAASELLSVNELILWSRLTRDGTIISRGGLTSTSHKKLQPEVLTLTRSRPLQEQLPVPESWFPKRILYQLEIPLSYQVAATTKTNDRLEIGFSFEPLYLVQKNILSLSAVLFITTLLFLLVIYIFIDTHLVTLIEKLTRAFSLPSDDMSQTLSTEAALDRLGENATFFYPVLQGLTKAVKKQSSLLTVERSTRRALEAFNTELNRQLDEQRKRLEHSHRQLMQSAKLAAIGELSGGVAHEINNPNGVILAGAKHLQSKLKKENLALPDYVQVYLDRIVRQANRIAEIVNALLTFSRRRPLEKTLLSLLDPVRDALDLASHRFKNISYELKLPDEFPRIRGNRNELGQVFLNLFNNAADVMPTGGKLTIWADIDDKGREGDRWLKISVHNTGENIPEDLLEKIMEPFFTTKPVGQGTGLGLSVSLGIIEEHGGFMKARNHGDGGAVFEIGLPVPPLCDSPDHC